MVSRRSIKLVFVALLAAGCAKGVGTADDAALFSSSGIEDAGTGGADVAVSLGDGGGASVGGGAAGGGAAAGGAGAGAAAGGAGTSTCVNPTDVISDGGFESGASGSAWQQKSTAFKDSVVCTVQTCGGPQSLPPGAANDGQHWVWLGGVNDASEVASVTQSVTLAAGGAATLQFSLLIAECNRPSDKFEVLIDGDLVREIDGSHPRCGVKTYEAHSVDIGAYADGGSHSVQFRVTTTPSGAGVTSFFLDSVHALSCP